MPKHRELPPTARRLHDLAPAERRRKVALVVASIIVRIVLLVGVYYIAPFKQVDDQNTMMRMLIAIALIAIVAAGSIASIMRAEFPVIRSVEAMATVITVTIVAFASTYLIMSLNEPAAFTEPLNQTGALYFSITTITTVGYGDVAPVTDSARIAVSLQMVIDLLIIGVLLRLMFGAAKRRVGTS